MTTSELLKILQEKGCVPSLLQRFADILPTHDRMYTDALIAYVTSGETPKVTVKGHSSRELQQFFGFTYLNAISFLMLIEDNEKVALSILEDGYDLIEGM